MESYTNYPDTEVGGRATPTHQRGWDRRPRPCPPIRPSFIVLPHTFLPPNPKKQVTRAHESGFEVVMTPRLDAEVSCVYFGWAKWEDNFFNPMKLPPVPAKDKKNVAAAFISNCGARSFRLKAIEELQARGVTVHSHGRCANNMPNTDKDSLLPKIKFSLAFENSIEPDYVTEKYLQALNFGAVPVVIGAPNIQDFAPSDNSIIHIPDEDVSSLLSDCVIGRSRMHRCTYIYHTNHWGIKRD